MTQKMAPTPTNVTYFTARHPIKPYHLRDNRVGTGGKISKERITVLVGCNSDGSALICYW